MQSYNIFFDYVNQSKQRKNPNPNKPTAKDSRWRGIFGFGFYCKDTAKFWKSKFFRRYFWTSRRKNYTDEELSYENDPIAKVLGKPKYSLPQTKAFAKRERMLDHADIYDLQGTIL